MDEFILEKESGAGGADHSAEFYLATVVTNNSGKVKIKLDGQDSAMTKYFNSMCGPIAADTRVIVMKQSGTYVVLGPVANPDMTTFAVSNASDIITLESGFTAASCWYVQTGKVAMLFMNINVSTAITGTGNHLLGYMKPGKRPRVGTFLLSYSHTYPGYINPNPDGDVHFTGSMAVGNNYYMYATYILA